MKIRENIVPVALEIPADTLTPVLALMRLSQRDKPAFLLESVEGGERLARYSFLGVDPFEIITVEDGVTSVQGSRGKRALDGHPFEAIGRHLSGYRGGKHPELPPFQGGAVGFLGYECAFHGEKALSLPRGALPGASRYDAFLMLFRNIIAFDHYRSKVSIIVNVFLDEESLDQGARRARREAARLQARLRRKSDEEAKPLFLPLDIESRQAAESSLGKAGFRKRISEIKGRIRAGDVFQCVLSDRFELPVKARPLDVYRVLRMLNPSPYLFYLSMGDEVLLGASPERLVRVSNGTVETDPIAGTRPRGKTDLEDKKLERHLLASTKERAEHVMLVDLGRNDIGRVSEPGSVRVHDFMHVERFSHVMHLVSRVEGKLKKSKSAWEALSACFPAGTLTGAPKIRAMQIIAGLEKSRRGPYGGAVVYSDFSGQLDSCITIRSLLIRGKKGYAQAGAGIVADSRAGAEYQEVLNKSKAIRRAVAIANANAAGTRRKR